MMKPRIAVSAGLTEVDLGPRFRRYGADGRPAAAGEPAVVQVRAEYVEAVEIAGGEPVVLGPLDRDRTAEELVGQVEGMLLTGGEDLDPALWNEPLHPRSKLIDRRRQRSDLNLVALAEACGMPVLGICLGCQEMAVSRGGKLIQHVFEELGTVGLHSGEKVPDGLHTIIVEAASRLAGIVGAGELAVNSRHHQAVRKAGRGMNVVARSGDRIIEAIEDPAPDRFFLGVQWHPEDMVELPKQRAIFETLCREAAAWRAAR
jgi:putative glutamine amidotransferase